MTSILIAYFDFRHGGVPDAAWIPAALALVYFYALTGFNAPSLMVQTLVTGIVFASISLVAFRLLIKKAGQADYMAIGVYCMWPAVGVIALVMAFAFPFFRNIKVNFVMNLRLAGLIGCFCLAGMLLFFL